MNDLFRELIQYLQDNFISYKILDDKDEFLIDIDEKIYQLFEPFKWSPEDEGIYFDEYFHWACDRTEYDYYIFCFGSIWYALKNGNEESVKLEPVKWLGRANLEDEALYIDSYLGVHGPFELLNGMGLYDQWCKKAKFLGITSIGLCEKGTLAASMKFQIACQKNGIRPIQGLEIVVIDEENDYSYTIKAFVKNKEGWNNLLQLNKLMNSSKTFIDKETLIDSCEGLILIWDPKSIDFQKIPKELKKIIRYYQLDTVEYQKEDRDETYLKNLKRFYDSELSPVAMCDAYYIEKEWAPIKQKMNYIAKKVTHESENQYMKNYQEYFKELSDLFADENAFFETFLDAVKNLQEISFECNFVIETQQRHMPRYYMTDEEALQYETNLDMFEDLIIKGLDEHKELLENYSEEEIVERLEKEMRVIENGDVVDYFLILRDIINWCRKEDILVGSGRGSACGCLVSYLMGLNHINPLDYDLLFERFLTTGRLIRHEKIEEVVINEDSSSPITIPCTSFVRIFRGEEKLIIKAEDLQEGDQLIDY